MNGIQYMIFIGEIVLQSKIVRRAAERLQVANERFDHTEIWSSIQSILVATGNISKILWPNKKYEKRGERLREILKVEKNSPINNREFRNRFFEHYDEMVEEWFKHQPNGVYIDLAMNPSLGGSATNNTHFCRSGVFIAWAKSVGCDPAFYCQQPSQANAEPVPPMR